MNNKILAARRLSPLARVWHSTGDPRMPLACIWVQTDATKPRLSSVESSTDETGRLRLCA
jgi:hypothetical protein